MYLKAIAVASLGAAALVANAVEPIAASRCRLGGGETQALAVPNDKAVLVEPRGGQAVLIQLITVKNADANYRWRLLDPGTSTPSSGEGRVFEDYEQIVGLNGNSLVKRKNSESDLRVFAGSVVLDWSARDKSSGWLYYCPDLANVKLVDLSQYKRKP